jgi:flagellar assembly protein FliH
VSQHVAAVATWSLPAVEGPLVARGQRADDLTPDRQAWDRGFAVGREAGVQAVRAEHQRTTDELQARLNSISDVLDHLSRPLAELDPIVEAQLMSVAASIARAVVRRELKTQPDAVIAVVRDTVKLLPLAARDIRVHLHPDDAAVVRERLAQPSGERAWTVIEDPVLSRGGCLVRSDDSAVDATVEKRLSAAIAAAMGDERSNSGRSA